MESKDIVETYLDRDLTQVLGEMGVQSIVSSETHEELTETEVNILAVLIQRRHEETSMERIRKNISLLQFRNVLDSTNNIESDDEDDDVEIRNFVYRLEKLHNTLETDIKLLEKERRLQMNKLEKNISQLNSVDTTRSDTSELKALTDSINSFNS